MKTNVKRLANMLDTEEITKEECYEYLMEHIKELQQIYDHPEEYVMMSLGDLIEEILGQ